MFKKILLPLDGSESSDLSKTWIQHYAPRDHAEIVLLRVIDTTLLRPEMVRPVFRSAQAQLQRVERELNFTGLPCKMIVRSGKPAPSIVREAQEDSADLVVLATQSGPGSSREEPGGVAEAVLRCCSVPILLFPPNQRQPQLDRLRRVIVPLDHVAEETVAWAARFARSWRAQLIFLLLQARRLRGSAAGHDDRLGELRLHMMESCRGLHDQGLRTSLRVLRGDPETCILESTGPKDLLLLTAPHHPDVEHVGLRGVEESILHRSEVPVIVLKESGGRRPPGRRRASDG